MRTTVSRTTHAPGRRWARAALLLGAIAALALAGLTVPTATAATKPMVVQPHFAAAAHQVGAVPSIAGRVAAIDAVTPTLPSVTTAYGVQALWDKGITGAGTTIAVVESFGDPNAATLLDAYSARHGLPPAQLSVISPVGAIPICT
ncbi:MAG TPA: hypothetical protein VH352_03170, partial [Pseudonocardiaceae bacterium]|nr:hypothetical protein [Pseudonocardiaceae bacterium]